MVFTKMHVVIATRGRYTSPVRTRRTLTKILLFLPYHLAILPSVRTWLLMLELLRGWKRALKKIFQKNVRVGLELLVNAVSISAWLSPIQFEQFIHLHHPRRLAFDALPLFPLFDLGSAPPAVFPAIQAAISKFCNGFAVLAPPLSMLFFCCSSNSFFISGSTESMHVLESWTSCKHDRGQEHTAIHQIRHPNHKC